MATVPNSGTKSKKLSREQAAKRIEAIYRALAAGDAERFYRLTRRLHGKGCECPNCNMETMEYYFPVTGEPHGVMVELLRLNHPKIKMGGSR